MVFFFFFFYCLISLSQKLCHCLFVWQSARRSLGSRSPSFATCDPNGPCAHRWPDTAPPWVWASLSLSRATDHRHIQTRLPWGLGRSPAAPFVTHEKTNPTIDFLKSLFFLCFFKSCCPPRHFFIRREDERVDLAPRCRPAAAIPFF
ncbi:hypothetical protein TW95_gp1787 [Pandoravirus inopinatum]|uniref:Uncharacterized protein n=1 Tax=Pandoravirus inopinatum TaxID=1605721 RepID=A0A0B5JBV9_9VIRU|nr:hypothetical protein TW95_gp1787 [Pandoravirus inopinatum]AJF98521.1 hypothetical protein [Pandoravirus inopinatum]